MVRPFADDGVRISIGEIRGQRPDARGRRRVAPHALIRFRRSEAHVKLVVTPLTLQGGPLPDEPPEPRFVSAAGPAERRAFVVAASGLSAAVPSCAGDHGRLSGDRRGGEPDHSPGDQGDDRRADRQPRDRPDPASRPAGSGARTHRGGPGPGTPVGAGTGRARVRDRHPQRPLQPAAGTADGVPQPLAERAASLACHR